MSHVQMSHDLLAKKSGKNRSQLDFIFRVPTSARLRLYVMQSHLRAIETWWGERRQTVQQKNRRSASHHRNDCAHANTSEKLIVRSIRANPKGLTLENFLAGCAECPWPSNSSFTSNSKVERFFTKSQQSFQF